MYYNAIYQILFPYYFWGLNNHSLSTSDQHPYLGFTLQNKLSWSPHKSNIAAMLLKPTEHCKHNLSCCASNIKATAYLTTVRPIMEYDADIRHRIHQSNIQQLEKFQRRAARWVLNDFSRYSSITAMINHLSWPSLESRRKISRLQSLYKIIHQHYSLSIPPHFTTMERSTRLYHPSRFVLPNSHTFSYQQSYYSRSIQRLE